MEPLIFYVLGPLFLVIVFAGLYLNEIDRLLKGRGSAKFEARIAWIDAKNRREKYESTEPISEYGYMNVFTSAVLQGYYCEEHAAFAFYLHLDPESATLEDPDGSYERELMSNY